MTTRSGAENDSEGCSGPLTKRPRDVFDETREGGEYARAIIQQFFLIR